MVPCISYWIKIIIQLIYNRSLLILFQFFWANKEFFITNFFNCHVETKGVRPKGTQSKKKYHHLCMGYGRITCCGTWAIEFKSIPFIYTL